jgi:hypothetical protein
MGGLPASVAANRKEKPMTPTPPAFEPTRSAAAANVDLSLSWHGALPVLLALMSDGNAIGKSFAARELERMARCADLANEAIATLTPLAAATLADVEGIVDLLWRASQLQSDGQLPVGSTPAAASNGDTSRCP